ncbi:MAG: esterase-like activity of phytase family protein [Polaromonas sp.]|uniref:esterase-like activity of phytase family protein n=1 Tax=Polaromonas sp. TaxID=1869339 RepID=UPI002735BABD|nr:esterase-like activity of phytase family protein [Polaromonas sp.]MDP2820301.1 esterase-like activity of phytase family protein [Polaromonas sp.]
MSCPAPPAISPELTRRQVLACGAAAALGVAGWSRPPPAHASATTAFSRLRLIGEARLPHRLQFQGTTVGGLSGIDYDPVSGLYYLISDDGSHFNPARFYTARIALQANRLGAPELTAVTTLRQADGSAYPSALQGIQVPDPEAIRWRASSQTLLWTSEGHALTGAAPALRESRADGSLVREFSLPAMFDFQLTQGPRINLTLEGLALSPDGSRAWVAMEGALRQDGPLPSVQAPGGPCRFTEIDLASGKVLRQIAYVPDAIPRAALPPATHADNGVTEILMLDAHRLLVLERAYMAGHGPDSANSLRLYLIDTRGGSDTLNLPALQPGNHQPVAKVLLADFSAFTGAGPGPRLDRLDNTEGMCWGPRLANGNRSLHFISDDNFGPRQITQWLAFEFFD